MQIFVMHFMTNTAYDSECEDLAILDLDLHDAAAPQISSISVTGNDDWIAVCRKMVEEELASEDEDLYDEDEYIAPYTWEDGNWETPEEGFPRRVFLVKQDGDTAAAMIVQRRPVEP